MKLPKALIALVSTLTVGSVLAFVGVDLEQCGGEPQPSTDAGVSSPDAGVESDEDAGR